MRHASGSHALWLGGSTCPSGAFPLPFPLPSVMLFFQFLVFRVFVEGFFVCLGSPFRLTTNLSPTPLQPPGRDKERLGRVIRVLLFSFFHLIGLKAQNVFITQYCSSKKY